MPQNSVILLNNAPYSKNSSGQEIFQDIPFTDSLLKPDLYNVIKLHKLPFRKNAIDEIMQNEGHKAVRLPPYHPDLNSIEMVWVEMQIFTF